MTATCDFMPECNVYDEFNKRGATSFFFGSIYKEFFSRNITEHKTRFELLGRILGEFQLYGTLD